MERSGLLSISVALLLAASLAGCASKQRWVASDLPGSEDIAVLRRAH